MTEFIHYDKFVKMTKKLTRSISTITYLKNRIKDLEARGSGQMSSEQAKKKKITDEDILETNIQKKRDELEDAYNVMGWISDLLFDDRGTLQIYIEKMKLFYVDEERKKRITKRYGVSIWQEPEGNVYSLAQNILTERQISYHRANNDRLYMQKDYEANKYQIYELNDELKDYKKEEKTMEPSDYFLEILKQNKSEIQAIKIMGSIQYLLEWAKRDHAYVKGFNDISDYGILEDIIRGNPIHGIPDNAVELEKILKMDDSQYKANIETLRKKANFEVQRDITRVKFKTTMKEKQWDDFKITPEVLFTAMVKTRTLNPDINNNRFVIEKIQARNDRRVKDVVEKLHEAYAGNAERLNFCIQHIRKVYNMLMKGLDAFQAPQADTEYVNIREIIQQLYTMKPYMVGLKQGHMKNFRTNLHKCIQVIRIMKQQMNIHEYKDEWDAQVSNVNPTDEHGDFIQDRNVKQIFLEAVPLILSARLNTVKTLNVLLMPKLKENEKLAFKHYMLGTIDALLGDETISYPPEYQKFHGKYTLKADDFMMKDVQTDKVGSTFTFKQLNELHSYLRKHELRLMFTGVPLPHSVPKSSTERIDVLNGFLKNFEDIRSFVRNMYNAIRFSVLKEYLLWIDKKLPEFQTIDNRAVDVTEFKNTMNSFGRATSNAKDLYERSSKTTVKMLEFVQGLYNIDFTKVDKEDLKKELDAMKKITENKSGASSSNWQHIPIPRKLTSVFSPAIQCDLEDPNGILFGDMWGYAAEAGESGEDTDEGETDKTHETGSSMFIGVPIKIKPSARRRKNERRYIKKKPEPEAIQYKHAVSRLRGMVLQMKHTLDQTWHNLQRVERVGIQPMIDQMNKREKKIREETQKANDSNTSPTHNLVSLYNFAQTHNNEDAKSAIVAYIMGSKKTITVLMQRMLKILIMRTVNYDYSKNQVYEFIPHFDPVLKKHVSDLYSNLKLLIKETDHSQVLRLMSHVINAFVQVVKSIFRQYTKKVKVTLQQNAILSFILHSQAFLNPFMRFDAKMIHLDTANLMNIAKTFEHMIQHILSSEDDDRFSMVQAQLPSTGEDTDENNEKPMTAWVNKRWDDFYISLTSAPLTNVLDKIAAQSKDIYPRTSHRFDSLGDIDQSETIPNTFQPPKSPDYFTVQRMESVIKAHFEKSKAKILQALEYLFNHIPFKEMFLEDYNSLTHYEKKLKKAWEKSKKHAHALHQSKYLMKKSKKIFMKMQSINTSVQVQDLTVEHDVFEPLKLGKNKTFICIRKYFYVYTYALYKLEKAYWKNSVLKSFIKGDEGKKGKRKRGWSDYESDNENSSDSSDSSDEETDTGSRTAPRMMRNKKKEGLGFRDKKSKTESNQGEKEADENAEEDDTDPEEDSMEPDAVHPEPNPPQPNPPQPNPAPTHTPSSLTDAIKPWNIHVKGLKADLTEEDFARYLHIHLDRNSIAKHRIKKLLPTAVYQDLYVTRSRVAHSMRVTSYKPYAAEGKNYSEATITVSGRVFAEIIQSSLNKMKGNTKTLLFGDANPEVTIEESSWKDTLKPWVMRYVSATRRIALKIANAIESLPVGEILHGSTGSQEIGSTESTMYTQKQNEVSYKMKRASDTWLVIVNHRLRHKEEWNSTYYDHLSQDMYFLWHCLEFFPDHIVFPLPYHDPPSDHDRYNHFSTYYDFYDSNLINAALTAMAYNPDNYEIGRMPDTDWSTEAIDMYGPFRERELRNQIRKGLEEKKKAWNKLMSKWNPTGRDEKWPLLLTVKKLLFDKTQTQYNTDSYDTILKSSNLIE
jgi:hypothetical protein